MNKIVTNPHNSITQSWYSKLCHKHSTYIYVSKYSLWEHIKAINVNDTDKFHK